ncbi:MAG: FtsX-like permease family protein, partial [Acidobacteriota bacterium]
MVLLIACMNVASLLLARAAARRREIATRLALGSSRGRLLQQFLAESLLLSLFGAVLGFALAEVTALGLAHVHLPLPIPIILDIQPDWRVAIYAALLTIIAALACGLLPAWQAARESISADLHRDGRMRLRRVLVSVQIAASVIVLTTGFLFLRNLAGANSISPGFDIRHTLRADVTLPPGSFSDPARRLAYKDQVLRELAAVPGAEAVAAARTIPFTDNSTYGVQLRFADNNQKIQSRFSWNAVTPEFFRAMDIPVLQGRSFTPDDKGGKPVIVNRTFVQRYLGGRPPVGTVFGWEPGPATRYRVVGVVGDTKTMLIGEEQRAQLYEPLDPLPDGRYRIQFVMRSAIPPALQVEPVRRTLRQIEPMAGAEVETMYSSIGFAFLPSQVGAVLLGSIGILGLLLASVGLYG